MTSITVLDAETAFATLIAEDKISDYLSKPHINNTIEYSDVYFNWVVDIGGHESLKQFNAIHTYYKNIGWILFPNEETKLLFILRYS